MAITQILRFDAQASISDKIQEATKALKEIPTPQNIVIGTVMKEEPDTIQISYEWGTTQQSSEFITTLRKIFGEPSANYQVNLDRAGIASQGPIAGNVVEFVQISFPASRVTPEFQKQIEADFERFTEIFERESTGGENWTTGWVVEEHDHEDIAGEKAKSFFVAKAWNVMEQFQESIKTESFKEAIPILMGWGAPFKMWHVEQKAIIVE